MWLKSRNLLDSRLRGNDVRVGKSSQNGRIRDRVRDDFVLVGDDFVLVGDDFVPTGTSFDAWASCFVAPTGGFAT